MALNIKYEESVKTRLKSLGGFTIVSAPISTCQLGIFHQSYKLLKTQKYSSQNNLEKKIQVIVRRNKIRLKMVKKKIINNNKKTDTIL